MKSLFILQLVCCVITAMLALQLAMASLQVRWKVWRYEISRWILVASMLFFSVHYLLQMIHGLRAQGTDVGAAFNILFYTPVAFAITLSIINIESTGNKVRRYCLRGMMAYILIAIVFVIGMFKSQSLHIGNMLYVMLGLFVASMAYFILIIRKETKARKQKLMENFGIDLIPYVRYSQASIILLYFAAGLLPVAILFNTLLYIIGPLILLSVIFFVHTFIAMGYYITPSLMAKASFGYDVRLPSEEELLGDGYVIAPAGNLTPERNISVNIGMLFDLTGKASSNLQIELNGYYMHLKDMIRFTGGFLQSQYQNFGEMRTLGMEAEVKADMTRWLYGYVNATYQDLRDVRKYEQNTTVANPTKGSRMPNIPYLMANAGLEFHKENLFGGSGMNTRIFTDASFVEEYLYDFEQSQFQQHRIPRALSCNIGFEQSFGNGRYFIMGKINNLTDTKMISEFNRPLPGRSFTIRFRYVFK